MRFYTLSRTFSDLHAKSDLHKLKYSKLRIIKEHVTKFQLKSKEKM